MDSVDKIDQLRAMLNADPADALGWFLLGTELLRSGDPAAAADALARCLTLTPRHTAACKLLGDAHRKAGAPDAAREAYNRAVTLADETGELQVAREARALLAKLPPDARGG